MYHTSSRRLCDRSPCPGVWVVDIPGGSDRAGTSLWQRSRWHSRRCSLRPAINCRARWRNQNTYLSDSAPPTLESTAVSALQITQTKEQHYRSVWLTHVIVSLYISVDNVSWWISCVFIILLCSWCEHGTVFMVTAVILRYKSTVYKWDYPLKKVIEKCNTEGRSSRSSTYYFTWTFQQLQSQKVRDETSTALPGIQLTVRYRYTPQRGAHKLLLQQNKNTHKAIW